MYKYSFIFQNTIDGEIKGNGSKTLGVLEYPYPLKTGDNVTIPEEWLTAIQEKFLQVNAFEVNSLSLVLRERINPH